MTQTMPAAKNGHRVNYRVYYEDTDTAGIVYYGNYLRFAERGRTEWLRNLGIIQSELWEKQGVGFVVTRLEIDFKVPARLDDEITVESHLHETGKVRMTMQQRILRGSAELALLTVNLACVDRRAKPVPLPDALVKLLA